MIELSFDDNEAVEQASRCLTCHTSPVYDGDLCIICGRCVDICPQDCLSFVSLAEIQIDGIEDSKGWTGELGLDTSDDVSVLLKDDEKCIRCGLCASRCPTDALTMETIVVKEQPVIAG
jgi:NAD-dependent dihydropyrimidine dehydrogenase PreA subunit